MDALLRERATLVAVLGAGAVIGVSGIYLYFKLNRCLTREISNLSTTVENLRRELEELRATTSASNSRKKSNSNRRKNSSGQSDSDSVGCGYYTANPSSGDDEAEEYFDFSDDSDEVVQNGSVWSSSPKTTSPSGLPKSVSFKSAFDEIDKLLDGGDDDQQTAYIQLTLMKENNKANPELLWRFAKACHLCSIIAVASGDLDRKKDMILESHKYAKMALSLDDTNSEIHKWYAITLGNIGEYGGMQEKIRNGYVFREHVDLAVKLNPDDPTLYHMRGRWCYEISMLTWIEKKFASTLYGAPPTATVSEAKAEFLMAEDLKPGQWKENMLYVAKCLIAEGDYASAVKWLDKALALLCKTKDDELSHKEVDDLLCKYQRYRISETSAL